METALNMDAFGQRTQHWHMSADDINALKQSGSLLFRAECYDSNNNFNRYWGGVTNFRWSAVSGASWSNQYVDKSGSNYATGWASHHYGLTSGNNEGVVMITCKLRLWYYFI